MTFFIAIISFIKQLLATIGIIDRWIVSTDQEQQDDIRRDDQKENDAMKKDGRPK